MSNEEATYDSKFWTKKLGKDATKLPENERLYLAFSILIHLRLPLATYLYFLFTSPLKKVKQRAGIFMAYSSTPTNEDEQFPPGKLLRIWHDSWPRCIPLLHESMVECGEEIAVAESKAVTQDQRLKIHIRTLTIEQIRTLLDPRKIAQTFQDLAPFTWRVMTAFSTAPNHHRTYNKPTTASTSESDEPSLPFSDDFDDWDAGDEPAEPFDTSTPTGFSRNPGFAVLLAISMLAFACNTGTNILPLLLGLFFKINGTSTRVIQMLSNASICVSERTCERLKERISEEAIQLASNFVHSGNLFYFLFDNINLYQRKHSQRINNQNSMIHATNSAIIAIDQDCLDADPAQNLADKLSMRGKRSKAVFADITPSREDSEIIARAFQAHIALFIIRYSPGSEKWKGRREMEEEVLKLIPEERPLPPRKTEAYPLGVFDVNEGSKKGLIKLLSATYKRLQLTAEEWALKVRYLAGDWASVANFRGARRQRNDDVNANERLEYGEDTSTLWHYGLQSSHMLMRTHLGSQMDHSSLASHKATLGRKWDVNKPNYAAAKSLIRHSAIARILHILMVLNGFLRWSELEAWRPDLDEIKKMASRIQQEYTTIPAARKAQNEWKDDWFAHTIYFLRDALLFIEFEDAVSCADAGRVLRVLRFWTLAFRGVGQHNYARECAEILIRWKYETTHSMRQALERSWFFNRWGLPRRWIASDLYMEQLNFWVKRVFIAQGSGVTIEYIMKKGSSCVEAFREVSHLVANFFGDDDRSRRSKEVKFREDLRKLVESMANDKMHDATKPVEHFVPAAGMLPKSKGPRKKDVGSSAVYDVLAKGVNGWSNGLFFDFLKSTTYDPAIGYPVDVQQENDTIDESVPLTRTVLDSPTNPLSHDSYADVHGDETRGCGSLGGGDEFETGEVELQ